MGLSNPYPEPGFILVSEYVESWSMATDKATLSIRETEFPVKL
jgi:hypothetical protein